MDFVTDAIAIGRFLDARDGEAMATAGITGVLCLAKDRIWSEGLPGVEADAWPLIDGEGNLRSDLEGALRKLDRLLARHAKVIVHCNAGKSRSCALVAAWLVKNTALTLEQALAQVAEKRPVMSVAPGLIDLLEDCL